MKDSWSHQKRMMKQAVPSPNDIYITIKNIEDLRVRALVTFAYLTGGRISEVVKCTYLRRYIFDYESLRPKSCRLDESGKRILLRVDKVKIDYPGVCKKDISYTYLRDKRVMLIDMQNRKSRKTQRKYIPILIDREQRFVEIVEEYLMTLKEEEPLFDFLRHHAYNLIRKTVGYNCHLLRHYRAIHLVTVHGMREFQLEKFMGWTDGRPAKHYVKLDWRDIWND